MLAYVTIHRLQNTGNVYSYFMEGFMSEPDNKDAIDHIIHKANAAVAGEVRELNKVVTIRIPQSLHEALKEEAHQRRCSMNKLASAKLRITGAALDQLLANSQNSV